MRSWKRRSVSQSVLSVSVAEPATVICTLSLLTTVIGFDSASLEPVKSKVRWPKG